MTKTRLLELGDKIKFVEDLEEVITHHMPITHCFYDIYVNNSLTIDSISDDVYEYLIVEFEGGSYCVASCNGCSKSAILEMLSKLVDGGYYNEVDAYNYIRRSAIHKEDNSETMMSLKKNFIKLYKSIA